MHIGEKIERIRLLRGITQAELGKKLGITKQAVSKMERSQKMDENKMRHVFGVLGVNTIDINFNKEPQDCSSNPNSKLKALLLYEELIKIERENFDNTLRIIEDIEDR